MAFLIDHYMALQAPQTLYPNKKNKKKTKILILKIIYLLKEIWLFKEWKNQKIEIMGKLLGEYTKTRI